jgi:hypothetical protein
MRRILLISGVLASLLYVGIDVLAALRYPEYHSFTDRMISELMATGAPTERLVDPLFLLYGALMMAFGMGVWRSGHRRRFGITGGLLFAYGALGLLGPTVFEMNVRGSGGDPDADLLHIALTAGLNVLMFAAMGFGASLRGRWFRRYTYATVLIMIALGFVTWLAARGLGAGEPTPWLGFAERVLIGTFLLWVAVLAISLWRAPGTIDLRARKIPMPPSALPAR